MSNFEDKNEDAEYILSIVIDEEFDEKNAAKHHEKITNDENVWQVVVNPLDIDYDALTRGVERFKRTGEGQYVYGNVNDVMFRIGGSEHSIKKSELRREVQRVDADITSAVNDTAAELNTEVQIVSDIADVPDARTIWKYREEPTRCGAYDELFKQFYAHLQSLGLIVNEGKIIDASFVVSPRQRNTREENRAIKKGEGGSLWNDNPHKKCHKDIDARWTKKGGETFYGYKNHAKVCSKTKLITGYDTTSASIYTIYYRVVTLTEKTEIYTKIRKSFANFVETKSQ